MTEACCTLTIPALSHDGANALASALEDSLRIDPMAITINETDEAKGLWEVALYFETEQDAENARALDELKHGFIAPITQQDWVRQSLEGLAPVTAGRFFLHGSHDRDRRRPGGIALEIDAGTAFGTGHHGTTEGCLIALDHILKRRRPESILDVGCGTGVLAIAAAKATGRPAIASDIDPEAVRVTRANASLNGVKPRIASLVAAGLGHPRIAASGPYDLIFANILARPLVALSTGLARALAPGGNLILSGLTLEQMRWIEATYLSRGLALASRITRGNWATLVFTLPQKRKRPGGRTPGRLAFAGSRGAGWEFDR
ncbi:MAG: 50S ribosomal protein L11 methyltransferase [Aestuariivirga sp.]|uniref:50S ribosomal protein L11 methyltransferase n=1 Tax=Aestuariivirga sp. TaxID=2650926 RepID=UPI0025BBC7F0|nr:50S ribosomal protein L11 methyltransferase [Aestuariivirga sp.]MCA3560405.1 50S ribosomal protein L11 methyltransferase [Aestuariivirga sp.]